MSRTTTYKRWARGIRAARPVCEDCNLAPSRVVAHLVQPILGGGLTDPDNVKALCYACDRLRDRTTPVIRRRPRKRSLTWQKLPPLS